MSAPLDLTVRIADYVRDYETIRRIRFAVFVDEQRVPENIEMDDRDAYCVHVLAFQRGEAVGTGRIDPEQGGKIGRVAVLAPNRGRGAGAALMQRLHEIAQDRGLRRVWCHAQVTAAPFYASLGYSVTSEPFDEAGIEHVEMEKELEPPPAG